MVKPDVVRLFEKYKVLNAREIQARHEVAMETYVKTINVEAQLMVLMSNRYVTPALMSYLTTVAGAVTAVEAAGGSTRESKKLLKHISGLSDEFRSSTDGLARVLEHQSASTARHAKHMRDVVVPAMNALRQTVDQIEGLMPHSEWPLPTYREMLFVK